MELKRRDVILAAIALFIAWGYATHWIPSLRFLPYAFLAGIAISILTVLWIILSTANQKNDFVTGRNRYGVRNVAFIQPQIWKVENEALKRRSQYISEALYPESPVVTQSIDKLIGLVLRDFVNSWYGAISQRPTFTNEVDRAIRSSMSSILDEVEGLDFVGVAVSKVVPMITTHMNDFYEAERAVRGKKLTRAVTESDELDLAVAAKYKNGKLHPAASLAFSDTKQVQQAHLRSIVMRLLPRILPPNMKTSPAVTNLVRELTTCAVLFPVVSMLADPDTWNQLIANYGRTVLQERKTVRKLRAALDEYAPPSPKTVKSTPFPKLCPDDNERKFERFIRAIRKCNTLSDARRFRSEVAGQLRREGAVEGQDPAYLRRLETGKRILDQRVAQLGASGSVQAHHKVAPSLDEKPVRTGPKLETATLREILYNASGLSSFMEYMDRLHLMRLVQFWIVVDGFRNPLEEDTDEPADHAWTEPDRQDLAQINDGYLSKPEIKASPVAREAVKAFLRAGPTATNIQYQAARRAVLRTQTEAYEMMQEPYFSNFKKTDMWFKLLATEESQRATSLAEPVEQPVRRSLDDRPSRPSRLHTGPTKSNNKAPDLRRAVASSADLKGFGKASLESEAPSRRSLDNGSSRAPLFDDDIDSDFLARSTASLDSDRDEAFVHNGSDEKIVDAMQAALNDIMEEQPEKDSIFFDTKSPVDSDSMHGSMELPTPSLDRLSQKQLKPSVPSLGLLGTPGRRGFFDDDLFSEEQPKFLEDEREDSDVGSEKADEDAVHEAAPGDLGLAEAIDALTIDIEMLVAQESIVDSLTKKAELTNNAAELRILRKSKASLQREINRKEQQRQQYIIQESDNSLFGRANVTIQSIMVGREADGKEFAVYVIEVRRQAGEQMPAASWIVTRRYSEFHDLNKRLRSRFPIIRNLDFPRRQMGLKLQKDFLQKRRVALERYLQELLKVPAICRSRELRAFLSQHALPSAGPTNSEIDTKDFVSRIYNSVTDGMEEFLGNIPVLDQLSLAGQNLITAATTQLNATQSPASTSTAPYAAQTAEMRATAEAEAELRAFETLEPFVKPICDLFLETFELNRENNWLRGRAVVIVLQQLLGGTIERKVRENAKGVLSDESIARGVNMVVDGMWPGGVKKADGGVLPRSAVEKGRSRQEAGVVLASLIPEVVGSVVGRTNAQAAARRVLAMVNNERLLTHLVFTILDEVVHIIFGDAVTR
ncbi:intermediate filament protein-like protein [Tothia fuscella]|uniref:Intermediate filament protein-like protein n=1 Tax=Tothia fuscella TaxID=1048955 RepID=A0A9P4TYG5_9PEZI|nr:intermediate filament protein-like protein [Tothia fuscella]